MKVCKSIDMWTDVTLRLTHSDNTQDALATNSEHTVLDVTFFNTCVIKPNISTYVAMNVANIWIERE